MSQSQDQTAMEKALSKLRWPLVVISMFICGVVGLAICVKGCGDTAKKVSVASIHAGGQEATNLLHAAVNEAERFAAKFKQDTITITFTTSIPEVTSETGGLLELATISTTETFRREDARTTANGWVDLGTTVSEVSVPATYRYHLRLRDAWRIDLPVTNICLVYAPAIRPSLPPAIDTSRMRKKTDQGWGRFNGKEQMDALERSITPTLITYSTNSQHIKAVRETCRKTVAEFFKVWLVKNQHWGDDTFTCIKVIFPDEMMRNPDSIPSTIRLNTD